MSRLVHRIEIERLSPEDGGGYLAIVPELPGCMSDGETPDEALRNVQDAIEGWLAAAGLRDGEEIAEVEDDGLAVSTGPSGMNQNLVTVRRRRD